MKIKVVKKRRTKSKTQNNSQLELKFIDSSKQKNKEIKIFPKLKLLILYLEYF